MTLPKRATPTEATPLTLNGMEVRRETALALAESSSFALTPPPAVASPPPPIPTFDAVNIRASDGSVWRIRVTPMGSMLLDRIVT
jgi:hypothetical protein